MRWRSASTPCSRTVLPRWSATATCRPVGGASTPRTGRPSASVTPRRWRPRRSAWAACGYTSTAPSPAGRCWMSGYAGRRRAELRESLARDDHLAVGFVAGAIEAMLAIRSGDLDRAEALARACAERGRAAGDADATGWYGSQVVAIRWYQGRLVETLPMLTELVNSPTLSATDNSTLAALAVAAALAGDRSAATSALARLCGTDLAALPRSSSWLVSMNGIVEAAHLLADADTSGRAYELLSPYADLPMVGSLAVACFGSVQHALGVAALTAGELDRAVAHFHAAVRQN